MDGNMNFDPMTGQPLNNPAPQPEVQPPPVYTQPQPQPVYTQPVYTQPQPQPVYTQPVYTQPVYTQPVYTQAPVQKDPVVFPGKEIVAVVFGGFSLFHSLIGAGFSWFPFYGWFIGGFNAVFGLICAIVAKANAGKVKKEATSYTGKVKAAGGLSTAGLILSILGILEVIISVIVVIIFMVIIGGAGISDILNNGYTF